MALKPCGNAGLGAKSLGQSSFWDTVTCLCPICASQSCSSSTCTGLSTPPTGELHNSDAQESSPWHGRLFSPWVSQNDQALPTWLTKIVMSDGGGVRGYSSLLILGALTQKIEAIEKSGGKHGPSVMSSSEYPWHIEYSGDSTFYSALCFDYMAGTSTGGSVYTSLCLRNRVLTPDSLSTIMLGRLRMSVEEALQQCQSFGTAVFGKSRWFHERSVLFYPKSGKPYSQKYILIYFIILLDKNNKVLLLKLGDFSSINDYRKMLCILTIVLLIIFICKV